MHRKKIALLSGFITLTFACCIFQVLRSPKPEWDQSPETIVLSEGPYVLAEIDYNYIPKYRIWGDGYIVWVEYDGNKNRTVFHGYLTKEEMTRLVTRVVDKYFDVRRKLRTSEGFPYNSIEINLLDGRYSEMIPPDDKELYEEIQFLGNGAGVTGTEFTPSVGELLVVPVEETEYKKVQASFSWPDEKFGYNLGEIPKEMDIDGEELLFAWEIVNAPNPIVESDGKTYWIAVIVPKISY
jgi:hypothetical protein